MRPWLGKLSGLITRKNGSNDQLFVDRCGSFGSLALPIEDEDDDEDEYELSVTAAKVLPAISTMPSLTSKDG
jgi:hypothetical protein